MKKYFLFLLLMSPNILLGFTAYHLLFNPETQKSVLIYGDTHNPLLAEINTTHAQLVIDICFDSSSLSLEKWGTSNNKKIDFFFESPDLTNSEIASLYATDCGSLAPTVHKLLTYRNNNLEKLKESCINFQPYEERNNLSALVNGIFENIQTYLTHKVPTLASKAKYLESPEESKRKIFFEQGKSYNELKRNLLRNHVTIGHYLHDLNAQIETVSRKFRHISDQPIETNSLIIQVRQAQENIRNLLRENEITESTLLVEAIFQIIEKQVIIENKKLSSAINETYSFFLDQLDYIIADIAFITKTLESQRDSDITIIVTGEIHIPNIVRSLQERNYDCIKTSEVPKRIESRADGVPRTFYYFPTNDHELSSLAIIELIKLYIN